MLGVASSSVKTHVGHLLAKLGFTDRVQLVVFAYDHELVRPHPPDDAAAPRLPRRTGTSPGDLRRDRPWDGTR